MEGEGVAGVASSGVHWHSTSLIRRWFDSHPIDRGRFQVNVGPTSDPVVPWGHQPIFDPPSGVPEVLRVMGQATGRGGATSCHR
jgi:hypothetical protein